jgi:hypothetical protein
MRSDKPVCRIGLKGKSGCRRPYLYYLSLKPYWGKLNVRNFRGGTGNVNYGGIRNPSHISKECVSETLHLRLGAPELYSTMDLIESRCAIEARKLESGGITDFESLQQI